MNHGIFAISLLLFVLTLNTSCSYESEHNKLTDEEIKQGWRLLFDGKTTTGWRSFQEEKVLDGWKVKNGELIALGKGADIGGDIISEEQFDNFELYLEWKISEGGNSGIFYQVVEEGYDAVYYTGPEYQLIDNVGFPEKLEDWQQAGANYAMHPAQNVELKPVGEYNSTRIIVNGTHVEHWLNGKKIVEFEQWTNTWKAAVANSKWKDYPDYALAKKGHLALQDHGNIIWFRNIKIREIKNEPTSLFNGKDLEGWKVYGTEKWYVENGELVCESGPDKAYGYLGTEKIFKNFSLSLEFKQEADGNSGVFFRSSIEDTKISGWQVEVAPPGKDTGGIYESYGRGWLLQIPDEKESGLKEGEWNLLKIQVVNDRVLTWLNGVEMADLKDEKIGAAIGSVALQIHDGGGIKVRWRNLMLTEM